MALTPEEINNLTSAIEKAIASGFAQVVASGGLGSITDKKTVETKVPRGGVAPVNIADLGVSTADVEAIISTSEKGIGILQNAATGFNAFHEEMVKQQTRSYYRAATDIIRNYGLTSQELVAAVKGDVTALTNASERAAAESFISYRELQQKYMDLEGFDPEEIRFRNKAIEEEFLNTSINLFNQNNNNIRESVQLFSVSARVSASEAAELVAVAFAETGEVSSKVLTDVTNIAESVSNATNIPLKQLQQGIVAVRTDMSFFTDMTVEGAAKMAASLSQVGLSVQSFKQIVAPFRDFDTAVTKIGDISAMFGVQMDAMEMMYLANEDENKFLHRLRDQLLDEGLDVNSMSKTRQRALADQLFNGDVKAMRIFMQTGQQYTDQQDLAAAAAEGSSKTQIEALDRLREGIVAVTKTFEDQAAVAQNVQGTFAVGGIVKYNKAIGGIQQTSLDAMTNTAGFSDEVNKLNTALSNLAGSGAEKLQGLFEGVVPAIEGANTEAVSAIYSMMEELGIAGDQGAAIAGAGLEAGAKRELAANSLPKWAKAAFESMADISNYQPHIDAYIENVSVAFAEAHEKLSQSFATNLSFSGMLTGFGDSATQTLEKIDEFVTNVNNSLAAIENPDITVEFGQGSELIANDVAVAINDSTKSLVEKFNKVPTEVNVNVDIESIKRDIVETLAQGLTTGFADANYKFAMKIDGTQLATIIADTKTSRKENFQMMGGSIDG